MKRGPDEHIRLLKCYLFTVIDQALRRERSFDLSLRQFELFIKQQLFSKENKVLLKNIINACLGTHMIVFIVLDNMHKINLKPTLLVLFHH